MELLAIISLVSSVLTIILFFKIWIMTNDVREIKKSMGNDIDKSCLVYGDKEEVKKTLCKLFAEQAQTFASLVESGQMNEQTATSRMKGIAISFNQKASKIGVDFDFNKAAEDIIPKMLELNNRL